MNRPRTQQVLFSGVVFSLLAMAAVGCTDVELFETPGRGTGQRDNKLRVVGEFCTEHPDEMRFPVKILFIIDCSQSMEVTDPPPSPNEYPGRVSAVWEVIQKFRHDPGVEFALIRFESAANVATQRDTNGDGTADMFGFVNDLPTLLRALNSLQAAGGNTSYQAALGLAEATLAMDMSNSNVDERSRAKYVIIFLSDGLPYPVDYDDEINTPFGIRRAVREMMNLAKRFSVADLTLHTAFLSVNTPQYVQVEAETLLKGMAEDGGGTFRNFENGEEINFLDIDYTSVKRVYTMKHGAFVVSNKNAHPAWTRHDAVDTDGDGMVDLLEQEQGTDASSGDTDGDGFNDLLEYNLRRSGFDPLDPDDADCSLMLDRLDGDGDGLLNCEERFLGTSPDLFDTDADGLPDPIETRTGTNPVWADADVDMDFDGSLNVHEVAWHTNPTFNDAERYSKLAYRYRFGRKPGIFESRFCYRFEVENITLVGTGARSAGGLAGSNDVMVYAGQVPNDDPDDYGIFRVACARVRYVPRHPQPDIKVPPDGKVEFEQKHFKRPVATACGSDLECPHHICDPSDHLCLAPLGERCDETTPCPRFACVMDRGTGVSTCLYPVATACLGDEDCSAYPLHQATGRCLDPDRSAPDPLTGQCPRRACVPQYETCSATHPCQADGDDNPDNDPVCLTGFCRVPCDSAGDCNPGESCEADAPAEYPPCSGPSDCATPATCTDGVCRTPCAIAADCPSATDTCEAGLCVGHHCVDHHGGTCAQVLCASDADCPLAACDPEVGRCRTQPCLDSRECPHQRCEPMLGVCMGATCSSDDDCRGERGFTCNPVVGGSCVKDIDCPFDFCTQEVLRCSLDGQPCRDTLPFCAANSCNTNSGRCTISSNDCTGDLECVPNTCQSYTVCANDPSQGCVMSLDCPQTFCHADGYCLNAPSVACDPATENLDDNCQVGLCTRADELGHCDAPGTQSCAADDDCPYMRCNASVGVCDYPTEVVCQTDAACPDGLSCAIPAGSQWGTCQQACTNDSDCPRARCLGSCRPLEPTDQRRCTDWFDPARDCVVFDPEEEQAGP